MAKAADARRRKKAEKKRTKAKSRQSRAAGKRDQQRSVATAGLGEMSNWPVSQCYIGASWHEQGANVHAVLTRYHDEGRLVAAHFEVDLADRGVISASHRSDWQAGEFEAWIGQLGEDVEPMEVCEAGLIVKLVNAAATLNADPPKGYAQALALIWDIEPEGPEFLVGPEPTEETEKPGTSFWGGLKGKLGL